MQQLNAVGFVLSLKCNLRCRHCCVEAGVDRTEEMNVEDVFRWLDETKAAKDITDIGFTGGEPFLYKDLTKVVQRARKLFPRVTIMTNGFWAKDLKTAKEVLFPLASAGLTKLAISADKFHQEVIPLEYVKNAIAASRYYDLQLKINSLIGSDSSITVNDLHNYRKAYIVNYPIHRAGRAMKDSSLSFESLDPGSFESMYCTESIIPTVFPDGKVYYCDAISFRVREGPHPMLLGNAHELPLSDILKQIRHDPLLTTLREGFRRLIHVIKEAGLEHKLKKSYFLPCDLCDHLLADEEMYAALQRFYSSEEKVHVVPLHLGQGIPNQEEIQLKVRETDLKSISKRAKLKRKKISNLDLLNIALVNYQFVDDPLMDWRNKKLPISILHAEDAVALLDIAYGNVWRNFTFDERGYLLCPSPGGRPAGHIRFR